jgi:hypothetical protein
MMTASVPEGCGHKEGVGSVDPTREHFGACAVDHAPTWRGLQDATSLAILKRDFNIVRDSKNFGYIARRHDAR